VEDPGDALGDDADLVVVRKRGRGNESEGRRKRVKKTLSQKEAKKNSAALKTHRGPAPQQIRKRLGVAGNAVAPSIDLAKDGKVEESRGDRGPGVF
jgi:hypothetical protein